MVQRAMTLAEPRSSSQRAHHVAPSAFDGADERHPFGDARGDGGRQGAPGTVTRARFDTRPFEAMLEAVDGTKHVDDSFTR